MSLVVFPSKLWAETPRYTFDFRNVMPAGTTIFAFSVSMSVFSGEDEYFADSMIVPSSEASSGSQVSVLVRGGTVGVVYELTCGIQLDNVNGPMYQQLGKIAVLASDPFEDDGGGGGGDE